MLAGRSRGPPTPFPPLCELNRRMALAGRLCSYKEHARRRSNPVSNRCFWGVGSAASRRPREGPDGLHLPRPRFETRRDGTRREGPERDLHFDRFNRSRDTFWGTWRVPYHFRRLRLAAPNGRTRDARAAKRHGKRRQMTPFRGHILKRPVERWLSGDPEEGPSMKWSIKVTFWQTLLERVVHTVLKRPKPSERVFGSSSFTDRRRDVQKRGPPQVKWEKATGKRQKSSKVIKSGLN